MEKTLGGARLGSGKKQTVHMREYERSTHDMGFVWRSTMASGTLVPFMKELALPGDTWEIDLNCDVKTHPTIGPLFGQYKVQLDVFECPIRLYNGDLQMNRLDIGLKMQEARLPQVRIKGKTPDPSKDIDNQQISPSSIFAYLDIRGLGHQDTNGASEVWREFNAVPWLAYWDIVKNYYANKQEEIGAVIHNALVGTNAVIDEMLWTAENGIFPINEVTIPLAADTYINNNTESKIVVTFANYDEFAIEKLIFRQQNGVIWEATQVMSTWVFDVGTNTLTGTEPVLGAYNISGFYLNTIPETANTEPQIKTFALSEIDTMRTNILRHTSEPTAFTVSDDTLESPYKLPLYSRVVGGERMYSAACDQEGLALKTYQSDLFNNWIDTEWIDGDNGINEITSIDTTGGSITINEINLNNKIYNMLNRIAISGGTYDDWLDATYTHERVKAVQNPMYMGGLIKELVFQEVISNAAASAEETQQPLGTLAGRGVLGKKHKGGKVKIRVSEPSYIIGIVSLTPRIDYSQGNKWDVNLKTLDDLHKPQLDEIGFQDLITDQMAWFDTGVTMPETTLTYRSAGKQPAWINYMTNVNVVRGNFAIATEQMFMVLNRRYERQYDLAGDMFIKDLTTYIDPSKFNHIFADTRRDAQNFWVQIGINATARRKMSARIIPNL